MDFSELNKPDGIKSIIENRKPYMEMLGLEDLYEDVTFGNESLHGRVRIRADREKVEVKLVSGELEELKLEVGVGNLSIVTAGKVHLRNLIINTEAPSVFFLYYGSSIDNVYLNLTETSELYCLSIRSFKNLYVYIDSVWQLDVLMKETELLHNFWHSDSKVIIRYKLERYCGALTVDISGHREEVINTLGIDSRYNIGGTLRINAVKGKASIYDTSELEIKVIELSDRKYSIIKELVIEQINKKIYRRLYKINQNKIKILAEG